jgi:putative mRNA 3-end processing factor
MGVEFHFDNGLFLTKPRLALDVCRRQPVGFISHAHADHMGRHELAYCTPATSALYQHRLGKRSVIELPFGEPREWGGLRMTTFPAGHVLGSAMLRVEKDGESLLYTGDFKLGESATARRAELPHVDTLIMETTFGDPRYRLPPREQSINELIEIVRQIMSSGATPIIYAYALGKSQEITRILTDAGIPVLQHSQIFAVSQVYEQCGCELGDYAIYPGRPRHGHVVIAPPQRGINRDLPGVVRKQTIGVTGWALDPKTRYRMGVDHVVPLSDHADYDELLETIERVNPRRVFCTHGPVSFVGRLRALGINAFPLDRSAEVQLRLF